MTRDEIEKRLIEILLETFELEEDRIRPDVNLYEDLGLDSIDAVDLFVQIRDVTGRRPDPAVAREVRTLSDLVAFTENELALAAAGAPEPPDPDGLGDEPDA